MRYMTVRDYCHCLTSLAGRGGRHSRGLQAMILSGMPPHSYRQASALSMNVHRVW